MKTGSLCTLLVGSLLVGACGRQEDRTATGFGYIAPPASSTDVPTTVSVTPEEVDARRGVSQSGTLHLIPDQIGIEGLVNYTIYDNGLLVYEGFCSYHPWSWSDYVVTTPFHGRYKADPASFLSETYANLGDRHSDFKLVMEVTETNDTLNVVDVDVRESDASGRFEIDTSNTLIDIHYAEVKGTVLGSEMTIRAKK